MGNKGLVFLAGGVIGAAIALLYAPRSGAETRAMVSEKVGEAWGSAQEFGAQASQNAQQFYQDATAKGQEVYQTAAAKGQQLYQDAAAKGQQFYQTAVAKGQEVVGAAGDKVQQAASTIKPVFSEKNDELREKIEAARQRIASQVARNAEESRAAAAEATIEAEPVVEPASDEPAQGAASAPAQA